MGEWTIREKLALFIKQLFCRHHDLYTIELIDCETQKPVKEYICRNCHKLMFSVVEDLLE